MTELAAGWCEFCEREVLAVPDGLDEPVLRCAHCDERLERLRAIDEDELDALGYEFVSAERPGGGCTSCATGGCGIPRRAAAEPNPGVGE